MVAFRAHFAGARTENDHMIEHDMHAARCVVAGIQERVEQILPRVGIPKRDAFLRSRDHDGLAVILNQVGKRGGGVSHRVRSVRDDKAVVAVIRIENTARHLQPVLRGDVRAVEIHQLHGVARAKPGKLRNERRDILAAQLRRQAAAGVDRRDGAAGRDQQNPLHTTPSLHASTLMQNTESVNRFLAGRL